MDILTEQQIQHLRDYTKDAASFLRLSVIIDSYFHCMIVYEKHFDLIRGKIKMLKSPSKLTKQHIWDVIQHIKNDFCRLYDEKVNQFVHRYAVLNGFSLDCILSDCIMRLIKKNWRLYKEFRPRPLL